MTVHTIFYYRDEIENELYVDTDPAVLASELRDILDINDLPTFPDLDLPELAQRAGEALEAIIIYKQAGVT